MTGRIAFVRFLTPTLLIVAALGLVSAVDALDRFSKNHALLINRSPSLPHWAVWLDKYAPLQKGDIMVFTPPPSPLLTDHFGSTPLLFGKYVLGVAGDDVTHEGQMVLIEGKPVAARKSHSKQGAVLAAGPEGKIPASCYYVGSPHKDGLDSRYAAIGFVCRHQILGRGRPIL